MNKKIILLLLVILALGQVNSQVMSGTLYDMEAVGDNTYKFSETWKNSKFQDDTPEVAVSISKLIGSESQYADKPISIQIVDVKVTTNSLTVLVECSTREYISSVGISYIAFDQGKKHKLAISKPIKTEQANNEQVVQLKDMQYSLECPTKSFYIMPLVQGYEICSQFTSLYLSKTDYTVERDDYTGIISGTHDVEYQIKCKNQDTRGMTVAFLYGCNGNLEVQKSTGTKDENKTPSLYFEKDEYSQEYRGTLHSLISLSKSNQIGSISFEAKQTEVKDGNRFMFSNKGRYTSNQIQEDNFGFYNAMVTVHGCDENCANCSAGGYCHECKSGYIFNHSRECVHPDYFTYYYVKGTNVTKVIGEKLDQVPGTGYFVNMVTSCTYDLEYLNDWQEFKADTYENEMIWQTKSLQKVIETIKEHGYWVHHKTEDDWYWIPPAFDPENPIIRWDIWKWVLDWLLKDYTPETYDRQISEQDFTRKCIEQKWLYSSDEIAYVFNHIAKQDSEVETISYNDVLRTLLQVEYGAYSRRILGDCNGISAEDIAISQGIAQKTKKVRKTDYDKQYNQDDSYVD